MALRAIKGTLKANGFQVAERTPHSPNDLCKCARGCCCAGNCVRTDKVLPRELMGLGTSEPSSDSKLCGFSNPTPQTAPHQTDFRTV